ncbi:MAG: S41 family peptidase [Acholeplasmataceae bacterium]
MANKKLGILFLITVLLAFTLGYFSSQILPQTPFRSEDMFERINEEFRSSYYYNITDEDITTAYIEHIRAVISTYGALYDDPYTRLDETPLSITPSSAESYVGLGIYLTFEAFDIKVLDVFYEGSVYGMIFPNDLIIGRVIDDEDALFEDFESQKDVLDALRGTLDEQKTLIVKNPDGVIRYETITYLSIPTPSVVTIDLGDDIAYIRINDFTPFIEGVTPGTSTIFSDVLYDLEQSLLNENPANKTLILDVRGNPGGSLSALHNQGQSDVAPGILQQLIPKNTDDPIFEMRNRTGTPEAFYGGLNQPKPYQIKVLVNEKSASASEVLAASLYASLGTEIYGQPTFGKKFFQNVIYLFDISDIRYNLIMTQGIWTYADGKNIVDDPLPVNLLDPTRILLSAQPIYEGEVMLNDVHTSLSLYQAFLNHYFEYEGAALLRTDGYFDQATRNAFLDLQLQQQTLSVTGRLDYQTSQWIFMHYQTMLNEPVYDQQLSNLIAMIRNG